MSRWRGELHREATRDLSVVIPVYNEEENLPPLHERLNEVLPQLGLDYEIIFVDDGSTDRSFDVLRRIASADHRVRVVRFARNAGQTAAFDAGFKASRGAVVVTLDADLQNDPRDIPRLLELMDRYDVVCGWRQRRADNIVRRVSSRLANAVRNALTNENIRDVGCSLKAFRRECLRDLKLFRGLHRFFPTLLRTEGWRVVEVPVRHAPRLYGQAKYGVFNRVFRALADLFAVRWMIKRRLDYEVSTEIESGKEKPPCSNKS